MLIPRVNDNDHIIGLPGADSVVLVEYGSYDCAKCHDSYYVVRDIQRFLGNHLTYVFRPFPLSCDERSPSFRAAEAAEAAGAQGWFWEMHDHLFEHQFQLDDLHLARYAQNLSLDIDRFHRELNAQKYVRCVRESLRNGVLSGIKRIPALFINGRPYEGPLDLDELFCHIEEAGC